MYSNRRNLGKIRLIRKIRKDKLPVITIQKKLLLKIVYVLKLIDTWEVKIAIS